VPTAVCAARVGCRARPSARRTATRSAPRARRHSRHAVHTDIPSRSPGGAPHPDTPCPHPPSHTSSPLHAQALVTRLGREPCALLSRDHTHAARYAICSARMRSVQPALRFHRFAFPPWAAARGAPPPQPQLLSSRPLPPKHTHTHTHTHTSLPGVGRARAGRWCRCQMDPGSASVTPTATSMAWLSGAPPPSTPPPSLLTTPPQTSASPPRPPPRLRCSADLPGRSARQSRHSRVRTLSPSPFSPQTRAVRGRPPSRRRRGLPRTPSQASPSAPQARSSHSP
jgi:hypothetical protein